MDTRKFDDDINEIEDPYMDDPSLDSMCDNLVREDEKRQRKIILQKGTKKLK